MNGKKLQELAANGQIHVVGPRVLLEAIHEHSDSVFAVGIERSIKDAIAFKVLALGHKVPSDCGFGVGDTVLQSSISGELADQSDPNSAFWFVHFEDVLGVVAA